MGINHLRAGHQIRNKMECSLPYHLKGNASVRKGCIIQYFYCFSLFPYVFFTCPDQMDCLISYIYVISNLNDQILKELGVLHSWSPNHDPNLVCNCLLKL